MKTKNLLLLGLGAAALWFATKAKAATGLKIVSAHYGDFENNALVDVTADLQSRVVNNRLDIPVVQEDRLNWSDPAPGVWKQLYVVYSINGVEHTITVDQPDPLFINGQ